MPLVLFYMWGPVRQNLIAEHRFYVDQAKKRLLSQFNDLATEVSEAAEKLLNEVDYDPQVYDPYDIHEAVQQYSFEQYQMLSNIQERTRLSIIAGMYHEWDKQLRSWMTREMKHWHDGKTAKLAIWKADLPDLVDLLISLDWSVTALASYDHLDTMRLVVNVFKHGEGSSLERLKLKRPELFPAQDSTSDGVPPYFIDHTQMAIEDVHVDQFSDAIVNFWEEVPERIFAKEGEVKVPAWFEKAYKKDQSTPQ